ncbi:MAG: O-antigen ligase family protein [Candidatus Sumerlaeia bacterium]|nr:O-antigen ligase family protein [Candidatus Sumerlaeia bacterium]
MKDSTLPVPTPAETPRLGGNWHSSVAGAGVVLLGAIVGVALGLFGPAGGLLLVALVIAARLLFAPVMLLNVLVAVAAFDALTTILPFPGYTLTASKLIGYVLVLALALEMCLARWKVRMDGPLVLVMTLVVLGALSILRAPHAALALEDTLRLAQLGMLFIGVRQLIDTRARLTTLAVTLVASLTVGAVLALWEAMGAEDRIAGVSQNAAVLSAELLVGLGFATALWSLARKGSAIWWLGVAGFWAMALALLATQTRAAFVALPLAAAATAWHLPRRGAQIAMAALVLLVVGVLAFGGAERFRAAVEFSDNSTRGHLRTGKAGLRMTADNPLLGVGLGHFPVYYLPYSHDPLGFEKTAHNSYLSFSSELGLPGLVVFGLMLLAPLALVSRELRKQRHVNAWHAAILFGLVALALMSIFHTLHFLKYFWVLLALAADADRWRVTAPSA